MAPISRKDENKSDEMGTDSASAVMNLNVEQGKLHLFFLLLCDFSFTT